MSCHSSRKSPTRPRHTTVTAPKLESTCDNENSNYSSWLNNNNSTANDWKLSNGNNAPSFGAFSFTNSFNTYSGDGTHEFATNYGNYAFHSNELSTGNNIVENSQISLPVSINSPANFNPYSIASQAYIRPDFINQEAMKMAFHSSSDGNSFFH
uniref:Uncharacterized protein n=1 Tax=Panagrolaimus superbus TaxID=310955 RepID=A0A914Y9U1_9BILA